MYRVGLCLTAMVGHAGYWQQFATFPPPAMAFGVFRREASRIVAGVLYSLACFSFTSRLAQYRRPNLSPPIPALPASIT